MRDQHIDTRTPVSYFISLLCSKLSRSEVGQFIGEFYQVSNFLPLFIFSLSLVFLQDQILKRGMIILRQEVIEEEGIMHERTFEQHLIFPHTGVSLLKKLASIWTQFYTSILPTLQAIFAPVQVHYRAPS